MPLTPAIAHSLTRGCRLMPMFLSVCLFCSTVLVAQQIPVGTAIPVMIGKGFEANKSAVDKTLEGQVMQDVRTPSGIEVSSGAKVIGHIVNVNTDSRASGSSITLRFDAIEDHGRRIPIRVNLIALASMMDVADAETPLNSGSNTDPINLWVTRQIGGDIVYRGQFKVKSGTGEVGKWLQGGGVRIKLTPNPEKGCPNGPAYEFEQSVWIFSSDACGTYGYRNLKIAKSGSTAPVGDIVLQSSKTVKIRGGSGWLLTIVPAAK